MRKGPCANHERRKRWSTDGVSRQARGYGADWEARRKRVLARDPFCTIRTHCKGAPSTTVDHIKAKAEGGTDDDSNLRGACKDCHRAKSAREGARGKMRAKGAH